MEMVLLVDLVISKNGDRVLYNEKHLNAKKPRIVENGERYFLILRFDSLGKCLRHCDITNKNSSVDLVYFNRIR